MFSVRPLPEFTAWLDELKDNRVRAAMAARIKRLSFGLLGDFKAVGDSVIELRIDLARAGAFTTSSTAHASSFCLRAVPSVHRREIYNERKRWLQH